MFFRVLAYVVMTPLVIVLWLIIGVVFIPLVIILLPLNLIGELLNKTILKDTKYHYD